MRKLILIISLIFTLTSFADKGNVGMVKRLKVTLDGELLMAAKVDDKADAMVRIISTEKTANGFIYDLEFMGLEPGEYNLINYLRKASNGEKADLDEVKVEVGTELNAETWKGELLDFQKTVDTLTPWYKKLNYLFLAFWVVILMVIIFYGRKKKEEDEVEVVQEKSLNEKICDLLGSLEGNSTKELWQRIEGLIFQHWYERKNLEGLPMHEAIVKLKADSEAGPFILKLEKGLHSKDYRNEQEVSAMIKKLTAEGGVA